MKTETVYIADDGTKFATEAECVAHEKNTTSNRLLNLICDKIEHERRVGFEMITYNTVRLFIESNIDEINKILEKSEPANDGWISNIGRDKWGHPDSLQPLTEIEVKYRNGSTDTGYARQWYSAWRDKTDDNCFDIVAYRILKG